jgi:hypothetical protein
MESRKTWNCRNPSALYELFQKDSFIKTFRENLVTLDKPEELFAHLNEIEAAYLGYEMV